MYLELYNLVQDDFGRTRYDIAYRIGVPLQEEVDPALFGSVELKKAGGRLIVTQEEGEDAEGGIFDTADFTMHYELAERNRLAEELDRLLRGGQQSETLITSEYAGDQPDEFTFLEIDLADMPTGIYKLTVTATDVYTGQTAQRNELFRVLE